MSSAPIDRLELARWEADRHAAVLSEALAAWDRLGEAQIHAVETDPELRRLTDQLLFRFIKLQDCIGERLVPATLGHLAEPYEDKPMRDRLDRLEKLGCLRSEDWLRWRETCNRLAHEYPDAPAQRLAQLLSAIDSAAGLLQAYRHWVARLIQLSP